MTEKGRIWVKSPVFFPKRLSRLETASRCLAGGKASLSFLLYGSESTHGLRGKSRWRCASQAEGIFNRFSWIFFKLPEECFAKLVVWYQRLAQCPVAAWSASNFIGYPFVSSLSSWQYLLFQQFSDGDSAMLALFLFFTWRFKPYYDTAPQLHDLTLFHCWDILLGKDGITGIV